MRKAKSPPLRAEVDVKHTWNLKPLFKNDREWERSFRQLQQEVPRFRRYQNRLERSAKTLLQCYDLLMDFNRRFDAVATYAHLKYSENITDPGAQNRLAKLSYLGRIAQESTSFIVPELLAIPALRMMAFLKDPVLDPYRFFLKRELRSRPHVLNSREEKLLAAQAQVYETPTKVFDQITDADMTFGTIQDETGKFVEVTQSSFRVLLESPKRSVRKEAFQKYYAEVDAHKNSLAAVYNGSVQQDAAHARIRNFKSALEVALFDDKMPVAAYESLIKAVRGSLPVMCRYYELRRRALRLKRLHFYDTYVPLYRPREVWIPYEEGVALVCEAMKPLGQDYLSVMRRGLTTGRWVDRYENKHKESGAFSGGCYNSPPYILLNYKEKMLDSVFTLAHEAGHSMHSYYTRQAQPYAYAHYPILLAEIASTFNEQLLVHHLISNAQSNEARAMLLSRHIDEIRGTIFRQTMFAEFELIMHRLVESGEPLTLEAMRSTYRTLLNDYFGPGVALDPRLELECLRIPHFYRAFYVYKYATGLAASMCLADRVLNGGEEQRIKYLGFLSAGSSRYPLDTLKRVGVDLAAPEPLQAAMRHFELRVNELAELAQTCKGLECATLKHGA